MASPPPYVHGRGYTAGFNGGQAPCWAEPRQSLPAGSTAVLTRKMLASSERDRFLVVDGIWPAELLQEHIAIHQLRYPEPCEGLDPAEINSAAAQFALPPEEMVANLITLHPRIMAACAQLLGTSDLRLMCSNLSSKYGESAAQVAPPPVDTSQSSAPADPPGFQK